MVSVYSMLQCSNIRSDFQFAFSASALDRINMFIDETLQNCAYSKRLLHFSYCITPKNQQVIEAERYGPAYIILSFYQLQYLFDVDCLASMNEIFS